MLGYGKILGAVRISQLRYHFVVSFVARDLILLCLFQTELKVKTAQTEYQNRYCTGQVYRASFLFSILFNKNHLASVLLVRWLIIIISHVMGTMVGIHHKQS